MRENKRSTIFEQLFRVDVNDKKHILFYHLFARFHLISAITCAFLTLSQRFVFQQTCFEARHTCRLCMQWRCKMRFFAAKFYALHPVRQPTNSSKECVLIAVRRGNCVPKTIFSGGLHTKCCLPLVHTCVCIAMKTTILFIGQILQQAQCISQLT